MAPTPRRLWVEKSPPCMRREDVKTSPRRVRPARRAPGLPGTGPHVKRVSLGEYAGEKLLDQVAFYQLNAESSPFKG